MSRRETNLGSGIGLTLIIICDLYHDLAEAYPLSLRYYIVIQERLASASNSMHFISLCQF